MLVAWVPLMTMAVATVAALAPARDNEQTVTTRSITASVGSSILIPCNIKPSENTLAGDEDFVKLILWYKDGGAPLYRVDSRTHPLNLAPHYPSELLNGRSQFDVSVQPAMLRLSAIVREDEGQYKCRVDYRRGRTTYTTTMLSVIVPPEDVIIVEESSGKRLSDSESGLSVAGPYLEGSNLTLRCTAPGGKPAPRLTWYLDNEPLDDSYEIDIYSQTSHNLLTISSLSNQFDNAIVSCHASGAEQSIKAPPKLAAVRFDLSGRPLEISIKTPLVAPLRAGTKTEIVCQSGGSRPPAVISWWLGDTQLKSFKQTVSQDGNITTSILSLMVEPQLNGRQIICRAENSAMLSAMKNRPFGSAVLEEAMSLTVLYAPQVSLRLGDGLNKDSILEGSDLVLDCEILANPTASEVTFLYEGQPLYNDPSSGIHISNQSLILENVSQHRRGLYRCIAFNSQGKGESDELFLNVKFPPVCRQKHRTNFVVADDEQITVECAVDAEPSNVSFRWLLNGTDSPTQPHTELLTFTVNGSRSVASYVPSVSRTYGNLVCIAENEIGPSIRPCIYTILEGGPPEAVSNCQLRNQSFSSLLLLCQASNGDGLRETFVLEVYNSDTHRLYANISETRPQFNVQNLPADAKITLNVYVVNAKGRSPSQRLTTSTAAMPQKQSNVHYHDEGIIISPLLILLIGGGLTSSLVVSSFALYFCLRTRQAKVPPRHGNQPRHELSAMTNNGKKGPLLPSVAGYVQTEEEDGGSLTQHVHCTSPESFYKSLDEAAISSYGQRYELTPTKATTAVGQLPPDVAYAELTLMGQRLPLTAVTQSMELTPSKLLGQQLPPDVTYAELASMAPLPDHHQENSYDGSAYTTVTDHYGHLDYRHIDTSNKYLMIMLAAECPNDVTSSTADVTAAQLAHLETLDGSGHHHHQ